MTFSFFRASFETFGVVLVEALACGKPVIATDIGGPKEIITEEVGKLVPSGDSESLAEAIGYMLDHHQEYTPRKACTICSAALQLRGHREGMGPRLQISS